MRTTWTPDFALGGALGGAPGGAPGPRRALTLAALAALLVLAQACAPTIYLQRHSMQISGGGGRDSATEYHGEPTPIQVGVVEAILRDEKVWPIRKYFDTVLHIRKTKPDVSFIKKMMVDMAVRGVEEMMLVLRGEGVAEAEVDGVKLQRLFARIAAPHVARSLAENGWASVAWGPGGANAEGTMIEIGPGGGGYFTPYPKTSEVAVHVATEISAGGWKHFTYDVSRVERCFAAPTDAVTTEQASAAIVLQDDGGGDTAAKPKAEAAPGDDDDE